MLKTPSFVFDIQALKRRALFVADKFGSRYKLCYAVKANPHVTKELVGIAHCFEICSTGEYRICERCGVPSTGMVLSGVYKEQDDMRRIFGACGARALYTVESPSQAELLVRLAREFGKKPRAVFRLSSGNQFGMDASTLKNVAVRCACDLDVVGIQMYAGTQKKQDRIRREIDGLLGFVSEYERDAGLKCRRIEYGPGLPVPYFVSDAPIDDRDIVKTVTDAFSGVGNDVEIVIEAGRFIAAYCGEYRTKIVDIKKTDGINYAITDGGINHLRYYGQTMAMKLPYIRVEKRDGSVVRALSDAEKYTVCGALCTDADILARDCPLGEAEVGDTLVFERAGAYSVTECAYLFLSRDMPTVYKLNADGYTETRSVVQTDIFNG